MTTNYPKKYWWVVLIVVPIVIALIPILTDNGNGDSGIIFNNIDVVIEQAEQSISEESLNELKALLQKAMNLVESKQYAQALPLFESAADIAPVPALKENIKNAKLAVTQSEQSAEVGGGEVLANGNAKWRMIPNPDRVGLGRIVVEVPEDTKLYVAIFKAGEGKRLEESYSSKAFDLFPGQYDVKIHGGAIVESVPVRQQMDTLIRMGIFSIATDSYWAIFDEDKAVRIFEAYSGINVSLPVGHYSLKVGNVFVPITIQEAQTTQY